MIATNQIPNKISIAPMMDHTDRHFRYLMRLLSRHVFLYTEMITTGAILYGKHKYLLEYNKLEHPLGIQFGGSNPDELAECAKIAEDYGYDEINLNVGCPSNRVQNGKFGACLMASPEIVAECVMTMRQTVTIPVTVKSRTGIDNRNTYEDLHKFISTVNKAGCNTFFIHARAAVLNGLSPKENRIIPPLQYEKVYKIKQDFPELTININGGTSTVNQIKHHLNFVDGVMIGRAAYQNPYLIAEIDNEIFHSTAEKPSRENVINRYIPYIEHQHNQGIYLKHLTKHIIGLFKGQPGARNFRRMLCGQSTSKVSDMHLLKEALNYVL